MLDHRVFGARSRGRVFVLEWLFGAVVAYALMLLRNRPVKTALHGGV